jgi:hypothetical protein
VEAGSALQQRSWSSSDFAVALPPTIPAKAGMVFVADPRQPQMVLQPPQGVPPGIPHSGDIHSASNRAPWSQALTRDKTARSHLPTLRFFVLRATARCSSLPFDAHHGDDRRPSTARERPIVTSALDHRALNAILVAQRACVTGRQAKEKRPS